MKKQDIIHLFENLQTLEVNEKSEIDSIISYYHGRIDGYHLGMKKQFLENKNEFHDRKRNVFLNSFPKLGLIYFNYYNDFEHFLIQSEHTNASFSKENFEEQKTWLYYIFKTAEQMKSKFLEYGIIKLSSNQMEFIGLPNFTITLNRYGHNFLEIE